MKRSIAVIGTLDTKGKEHAYLAECIREAGLEALLIDVGTGDEPQVAPDIPRTQILAKLSDPRDRGGSVAEMAEVVPAFVANLAKKGMIHGIISLGGGGGTSIGTAAMRGLPIGFPKVMVSTLASGQTAPYVGVKDIVMMPSVVDVAGLNRVSKLLFRQAAAAVAAMVEATPSGPESAESQAIIAASMFGNTTHCVEIAKEEMEKAGHEVLVFHATGTGGRTMESLIESGMVRGVLDITTTEWADELVGGVLSAGPHRLEAAGQAGVPAVVVPGCLDMVNFGEPLSVPKAFKDRLFYMHNPQVTLMRTSSEECRELGRIIAEKVNAYTAPVAVLLPKKAISVISAPGKPFHDPEADEALFASLREHLSPGVNLLELENEINDPEFARASAATLMEMLSMACLREL